jgi:ubiquinol-cytochrome c reductase cytochrome c subunit
MKKFLVLASLIFTLPTSAFAASPVEQGRDLYMKIGCYQCHGTVGQGGVAGPRLAPEPMAWEGFAQIVHNSADAMPAYREQVLPDAQLKQIHTYLQSIPQPRPVDQIPLLRGKK